MEYTMYIPALSNIHGICMVYTIHIPCKIFIGAQVPSSRMPGQGRKDSESLARAPQISSGNPVSRVG